MRGIICAIMVGKKRVAKWAECSWCKKRGIDPPFRAGKNKTLVKHMCKCEAEFRLQNECKERPKIDTVLEMVSQMQSQIACMKADIETLKQTRNRYEKEKYLFWDKMTPKSAWTRRKENAIRAIRACLSNFSPTRYCKTAFDYLEMYLLPLEPSLSDILSISLWPVIDYREHSACLKHIETSDMYCIFKRIWGKTHCPGINLEFWQEVIDEVGLPERFFNKSHMYLLGQEFERIVTRFQVSKKRVGAQSCQGTIGLVRVWRKVFPLPDELLMACRSLGPEEVLTWKSGESDHLCPSESKVTRVGNRSSSDLRSGSD